MQIMEGWDYTTGKFLWRNNHTVLDISVNGVTVALKMVLIGSTAEFICHNVKTGEEQWKLNGRTTAG
jgi:outer membrane protein assembly factor BamB